MAWRAGGGMVGAATVAGCWFSLGFGRRHRRTGPSWPPWWPGPDVDAHLSREPARRAAVPWTGDNRHENASVLIW